MKMIKRNNHLKDLNLQEMEKKLIEAKTVTSTQNKKSEILIEHNRL